MHLYDDIKRKTLFDISPLLLMTFIILPFNHNLIQILFCKRSLKNQSYLIMLLKVKTSFT